MDNKEIISHIMYACGLLLTAILSGIAAWVSHRMHKSVEEVNDAVNHRHAKGGVGAPKLYDAMLHLHEKIDGLDKKAEELMEWKLGYASHSNPFRDADSIGDFVAANQTNFDNLQSQINDVRVDIQNLQIKPPCVIHESRLNTLERLVKLHERELSDQD